MKPSLPIAPDDSVRTPDQIEETDRSELHKLFSPSIDALTANNPMLLYTRLSRSNNGGHVAVVSGWKQQDGDLWLRITDPTTPNVALLNEANLLVVQQQPSSFSEY